MWRWIIGFAVVGLIVVGGFYAAILHDLPAIDDLSAGMTLPSTRILDRNGRMLYELAATDSGRNIPLPLDEIPDHCTHALIATEDAQFYTHTGVSLRGVIRAAWLNLRGGEIVAGGSTITQQVARNLLLDPRARAERTAQRKLREMVLALQLQRAYSKDEVLALWLNQTDFGHFAYGIQSASRAYFGKDAAGLSLAECALLIGLPQSPPRYDPLTQFEAAKARQAVVLGRMVDEGYITQAQADSATDDALTFAASSYPIEAPHAVLAVWEQLEQDYPDALYSGGLEVITTIDLDLQREVLRIARTQLANLNDTETGNGIPAQADSAAVLVLNPTNGHVLTMLGSVDYFDSTISGAMNLALMPRQPGSTLKPFTYALAMSPEQAQTLTAASILDDVRTPFVTRRLESYIPANFDREERGQVTVRESLASSYNIPAVLVLEQVGVQPFIQFMTALGVELLAQNPQVDLSVTLGGGEVRLLNLTAAYGALATGGTRVTPTLIQRVTTHDGTLLYEHRPATGERVMDERVAFLITDILSDDAARIPGFGANSLLNIGRPAAAKTGTTTDYRDNWVVGYTPQLVTGVWVGNPDYSTMQNVTGLSGAGPIWHYVMRAALKNEPKAAFPVPADVERVTICGATGRPPDETCTATRDEWFIVGTVPDAPAPLEVNWRVLSPLPYGLYEISPLYPPESQRLKLAVSYPDDTVRVTYDINQGETVIMADAPPFEAWLPLEVGQYGIMATLTRANGETIALEPFPFTVQPPQTR